MESNKVVRSWKEFEFELAKLGEEIREQIELEVEEFSVDPEASKARRERAWNDYEFFCKTYFPHYVPTDEFSVFHAYIFEWFPKLIDSDKDAREVEMAPRGEAKSTYLTQLGTLWCVVTGRKHMIGIIMNTEEQAAEMLEAIKAELDTNPRLAMDFPEACGKGRVWQATTAITRNNRKIRIGGTGKKIRGMKHGPHRPDLIFLDDLENDDHVRQKSQREKVEKFVLSAVLGLAGPSGGMDVFWPGTSLHYDAAINRVSRKPGWRRRVFRSIIQWPDNMGLWDQWMAIYTSGGDDDDAREAAEAEALAFYNANKKKMDAGAVVSWPGVRPLYRLMCMRAMDTDAFSQEQQNEAGNDEAAPFRVMHYWNTLPAKLLYFGAIDPSLGKLGKGRDPSAILVGGLDVETMTLYNIEADIGRKTPDMIIARAIELQKHFRCIAWAVETVQFQAFLNTELIKRAAAAGIAFPSVPVIPTSDKDLRIISLQPHVANGKILFHHSHNTLNSQFRFWPEHDDDDGPDAEEMLWKIAQQFGGEWKYTPATNRSSRHRPQRGGRSNDGWDDED